MVKKLSKREKKKAEQRKITASLKAQRMKAGDKNKSQLQASIPEPVSKPISYARKQRLKLESLTVGELECLVKDKCAGSQIYRKEGVKDSQVPFNYDGFKSDYGLKLCFPDLDSGREHYFGFDLIKTADDKRLIRIHYAVVRGEDGYNYSNKTKEINPKNLAARKLLDMIGEFK